MVDTIPGSHRPRSYDGTYMKAGKAGERIVMWWFQSWPGVLSVKDVSDDENYQRREIDCILETTKSQITVEIKTDRHLGKTGNFLFEILRIYHTSEDFPARLGWSVVSEADWLTVYAPGAIYTLSMTDFRAGFRDYTRTARKKTRFDYVDTDAIKSTLNVLIPIEFIKNRKSFKRHDVPWAEFNDWLINGSPPGYVTLEKPPF